MKLHHSTRTALRGTLTASLIALIAIPAIASAESASSMANLGKVTVTGTRIKRTNIVTAQPVTNISHQELESTGLKSIGQILEDLPSVGFVSGINQGTYSESGAQRIDLRYLGSNRLLVLLNGQRLASSFAGSVDLSQIPIAAVDHIQILQDGASAVYGSDAIAGVVNIITKKNFNGARASAFYGIHNGSGHWDGQYHHYAVTLGLSNDRGHFLFTGQYRTSNSIPSTDRDFSSEDPRLGVSRGSTTTPQGRFLFIAPSGGDPSKPGNPPAAFTGLTLQQCPDDNFGTKASPTYLPNCDLTIKKGTNGQSPSDYKPFTTQDRYDDSLEIPLSLNQNIKSIYTEGSYNLSSSIAIHANVLYNRRQTPGTITPALIDYNLSGEAIAADNPYNPFGFTLSQDQPIEVAPGIEKPTLRAIYRRTTELGRRGRSHDSKTFRFDGGFSGDFNLGQRSWNWDADYLYTTLNENSGETNNDGDLRVALATSPLCDQIVGCVPLNLFGGQGVDGNGTITPAQADYIRENYTITRREKDLRAIELNLSSSDIFDLPGGPLGFAAGYEHRNISGKATPSALNQFPHVGNIPPSQVEEGAYNVDALYGELNVPVLSGLPGANYLGIDAATRWSNYSTFGSTVNSRVGLKYQPIEDLVLRGTYAEGFRGADITSLYSPRTHYYPFIDDPCNNYTASGTPAAIQNNCEAAGVPASYKQVNDQFTGVTGGNPHLKPETSVSKTLGIVYSPSWLEGLSVNADYYNIKLKHTITTISSQEIFNFCYRDGVRRFCNEITRGPTGAIKNITKQETNLGGTRTAGFDVGFNYKFPSTRFGDFTLNVRGTHVNYFTTYVPQASGKITIHQVVGNLDRGDIPEWRALGRLHWNYGAWSANITEHYISDFTGRCSDSYNGTSLSLANLGLCSNPNFKDNGESRNHIGAATWYDVQVGYATPWNIDIALGARNIFEKKPPAGSDGHGYIASLHHDLLGRFVYGEISYAF